MHDARLEDNAAFASERNPVDSVFCMEADTSGLYFEAKQRAAEERLKAEAEEKRNTQQAAYCRLVAASATASDTLLLTVLLVWRLRR